VKWYNGGMETKGRVDFVNDDWGTANEILEWRPVPEGCLVVERCIGERVK